MQPIFYWIAIIVAMVALLIVRGGFAPPLVYITVPVLLVVLIGTFVVFRRGRSGGGAPK
jgi:hypothetical protein